jgi:hypothetical protein
MTEAEWLVSDDPEAMLAVVRDTVNDRKTRLLGCAYVRWVWSLCGEVPPRTIGIAEEYADGTTSKGALRRARKAVQGEREALEATGAGMRPRWGAYWLLETVATLGAYSSVVAELRRLTSDVLKVEESEWSSLSGLLRDIFGNPFRPVTLDPNWRTSTVVALAAQMYDSRDFSAMPILADALQDAGCDSAAILEHCRGSGPHVRGCWVVDLVLGKS